MTTAFVLSGGASLGAVQAGMLRALYERGIEPDIYVLSVGDTCALDRSPRGALAMVIHATNILIQRQLATEIEAFASRARLIVLPPPCPYRIHPTDFDHAGSLIEGALELSRSFLERELSSDDRSAPQAGEQASRRPANV